MSLNSMFKRKEKGVCPFCGEKVDAYSFNDKQSLKEFEISGLCQRCQDEFFR